MNYLPENTARKFKMGQESQQEFKKRIQNTGAVIIKTICESSKSRFDTYSALEWIMLCVRRFLTHDIFNKNLKQRLFL